MGDVVFSEFCGEIEISQTKCRSPTAASISYQHNLKPERLQHFDCSNGDLRFMVTHECVVPQNDFAASGERGRPARCFWRLAKNLWTGSGTGAAGCAARCVIRGALHSGRGDRAPQTFRKPAI